MNHIIWFIKLSNNVKKPAIFQKHYLYGVSQKLWCETGVRRTLIRNWIYMKYSDNIFDDYCGRSKAISKIQKRRQFRRSEKCWWKFMHIRYIAYNSFLMTLQSRGQLFTVGYIWIGRFRIKKIRRESICIYPNWTDLSQKCSFFGFGDIMLTVSQCGID